MRGRSGDGKEKQAGDGRVRGGGRELIKGRNIDIIKLGKYSNGEDGEQNCRT